MSPGHRGVNGASRLDKILTTLLKQSGRSLSIAKKTLEDTSLVINFLRGKLEFTVRPDDIFLVSYPRSGTTWLQMILYQLSTAGEMDFEHVSQVSPWYERSLAIGSMNAADFETYPSPRIIKSHLTFGWLPRGARYIYVARDGMDVAVSYYHFYRSHLGFTGSFDDFFGRFMRGDLQYRSWFRHVASWEAHRDDPGVLFLRYEDLKRSLADCVERIIDFCSLDVPRERMPAILERCSFEFMKKNEARFDHITQLIMERKLVPDSFIRKGSPGEGRNFMTERQRELFKRRSASRTTPALPELRLADFLH